jgi:hypothetical protein
MSNDPDEVPDALMAAYGMHVSGKGFWPRPRIVNELAEGLLGGESFTLFGLRRIGKSSVMAETRRRLQESGAIVVHVDAQNFRGLPSLFAAILRELPEKGFRDVLLQHLTNNALIAGKLVGKFASLLKQQKDEFQPEDEAELLAYWGVIAPAVGERLAASAQPFVLCIDELPMLPDDMLKRPNGVETANRLLAGLREWRVHPKVAMFLTGSVGIRRLAKERDLDSTLLNDMTQLALQPLGRAEAAAMLRALMKGRGGVAWPDALTEAALDRMVAFHPSVIQFVFRRLHSARVCDIGQLDQVFRADIIPSFEASFFSQFAERTKGNTSDLGRRLDRALAIVAVYPGGVGLTAFAEAFVAGGDPAEEAESVIDILREDGFIAWDSASRMLSLADGLVRAWWQARPRA